MQIPVYNPCAFSTTATSLLLVSSRGNPLIPSGLSNPLNQELSPRWGTRSNHHPDWFWSSFLKQQCQEKPPTPSPTTLVTREGDLSPLTELGSPKEGVGSSRDTAGCPLFSPSAHMGLQLKAHPPTPGRDPHVLTPLPPACPYFCDSCAWP